MVASSTEARETVMQHYMDILGKRVRDRVSGFKGLAVSVAFDLYGCVQVTINPGIGKDGKPGEQFWFDHNRLEVTDHKRVMPLPGFEPPAAAAAGAGRKRTTVGPAEKPASAKP
jgi:hypothetical protein